MGSFIFGWLLGVVVGAIIGYWLCYSNFHPDNRPTSTKLRDYDLGTLFRNMTRIAHPPMGAAKRPQNGR
jgi:hypothetical protein